MTPVYRGRRVSRVSVKLGMELERGDTRGKRMRHVFGVTSTTDEGLSGVKLLVNRIAPLIRAGGRLINLSSAGHRFSNVDLEDPNFELTPYEPFVAYGRSKTANILFAVAFDKRHWERGVRAAAVHPGAIHTELGRYVEQS